MAVTSGTSNYLQYDNFDYYNIFIYFSDLMSEKVIYKK